MFKLLSLSLFLASASALSQTNVLTYRNDNLRTAQNLSDTVLTQANVRSSTFGKLFMFPVDGKVDAQPLVVSGLTIAGQGPRQVVFTATEHDSVYAFDALTGTQYWKVSLLKSGETPSDARSCNQVTPEIGVTATPVIDLTAGPNGTIYVVGMSKDASGGYHHRLHALDLTTGAEQFSGPTDIQATFPGTGDNSSGGNVVFDPKQYKERTALILVNGIVYTSWASHCDIRPYTGWTMGYNQNTLAQTSVFNFTPNGNEAAIWGAGGGLAADPGGNLYYNLGNGTFDTTLNSSGFPNRGDFGNSFVKLGLTGGALKALDYWTMDNTVAESNVDQDLGSGGMLLLPDLTDAAHNIRHLGVGAGKDANVYIFDRDNMGKFNPNSNSNLYQELPSALSGGEFASPAWFNGVVYFGAVGDVIRAFPVTSARLATLPSSTSNHSFGYPGTSPSISANGTANGILWAVENSSPAVLHAYDATDLVTELYNSSQAPNARDQFGSGNKFITPSIANGQVFVGTQNGVAVFGLLGPTLTSVNPSAGAQGTSPAITLSGTNFTPGSTVFFSGTGVTVSSVNVVSANQITATLAIATNATLGARSLSVTTSTGTTGSVAFTITGSITPAPVLTSLSPSSGAQGTKPVVTVTGTNFVPGSTLSVAGIKLTNVTIVSTTQITATFGIEYLAAQGPHNVTVTNANGTSNTLPFDVTFSPYPPGYARTFQPESLPAVTSGPALQPLTYSGFADGKGVLLPATAVGSSVTFTLDILQPGNYDIQVVGQTTPANGTFQMSVNGVAKGPVADEFSNSIGTRNYDLGIVNIAAAGNNTLQFTVTGKNAASSGLGISLGSIVLIAR